MDRSVLLGKYRRSRPFVFSLLQRCHGLPGWAKKTPCSRAAATVAWAAISEPWSQVNDHSGAKWACHSHAAEARAVWGVAAAFGVSWASVHRQVRVAGARLAAVWAARPRLVRWLGICLLYTSDA